MQPRIELQFCWRRHDIKEGIMAVAKAVGRGYDTRDKLLAALPQFSIYRIALALDALITADMVENNLGILRISSDMDVVFELLKRKFVLPLSLEDAKTPSMRRVLIHQLGCKNPAGVEALLKPTIAEA